jgi:hypothetical protein
MVTQLKNLCLKVQKGAKFLDKKYPNWYKKIKLDRLDMEWAENCVLGQLYGEYSVGLATLNLHKKSWEKTYIHGKQLGFTIETLTGQSSTNFQYLTGLWTQEIRSRANKAKSA